MNAAGAEQRQKPKRKRKHVPYVRLSEEERVAAIAARTETVKQRTEIYHRVRDALAAFSGLPRAEDAAALVRKYERQNRVRVETWLPRAAKWIKEFEDAWNREDA